jgi:glycosyltransferase involved in cell wall biosynthesis
MKIINLLCTHFPPENTAASERLLALVKAIAEDVQVNVFSLTEKGCGIPEASPIGHDNVAVHYVFQSSGTSSSLLLRAVKEIYYAMRLSVTARERSKADIWLISIPYMFLLPVAVLFCPCRLIVDVRDIVWGYLPESSVSQRFLKSILRNVMQYCLKLADKVVVTNEHEQDYFKDVGLSPTLISNGLASKRFELISTIQFPEYEPESSGPLTITYAGNVGKAQSFESIVSVMSSTSGVFFNLIGSGNCFQSVCQMVENSGAKNVKMPGKISWEELQHYYQSTHVFFVSLAPGYETAMPSKLYECVASGIPVLFEGAGCAAEFLRNFENAMIVSPGNQAEMKSAIEALKSRKTIRAVKNSEQIKLHYLRESVMTQYRDIVSAM